MKWIVIAMVYGFLTAFAHKGNDFAWIFPALMLFVAWWSVRPAVRMDGGWKLVGAWLVMLIGIAFMNAKTGQLYFQEAIGPTVFGVPLAWPLMLLPVAVLATLLGERAGTSTVRRVVWGAGVGLMSALLIVPACFEMGLWGYKIGGLYYGTPWMQFAIWTLVGVLAVTLGDIVPRKKQLPLQSIDGPYLLIAFMAGISLGYQLVIPSFVGLVHLLMTQRAKNFL